MTSVLALRDGTSLAVRTKGDGTPVVFVHGSVGDIAAFDPWQFVPFSERYHVVAYSRRFHPPNALPPEAKTYDPMDHVEDMRELIASLRPHRPHIVASSFGGYIALLYGIRHPAAVRSLVLGEPPMLRLLTWEPGDEPFFNAFQTQVINPSRDAFVRGDLQAGLSIFLDGIRGRPGAFQALPLSVRTDLMRFAPEMSIEMTTPFDTYMPVVTCDELRSLALPVLLMTGANSPAMFHRITAQLARCLPHAHQVTIPNAGHIMHAANPAEYNRVVGEFLAQV